MHGAVLRRQGSNKILDSSSSGSCSFTNDKYLRLVTTQIFSFGHIPLNLSIVNCIKVRPTPNTSINCLGTSAVLIGQNLLPTPPAIITK